MTKARAKIYTHLWYAREAEEAARFYAAIFPDPSGPQSVERSLEFLRSLSGEI